MKFNPLSTKNDEHPIHTDKGQKKADKAAPKYYAKYLIQKKTDNEFESL